MKAIAALALIAAPVGAQTTVSPLAPSTAAVDDQARADAAAAKAKADAACAPMAAIPPTETVGGSAGSGTACRLVNSVQPRISRTVSFTTGSNGTAVITWTDMGAVPLVFPIPNVASGATQVPACYPVIGTATATGVTIKCFITQTLLGLGLVPFVAASAGVTGQVLALPAS
jgi:hypothetical protein